MRIVLAHKHTHTLTTCCIKHLKIIFRVFFIFFFKNLFNIKKIHLFKKRNKHNGTNMDSILNEICNLFKLEYTNVRRFFSLTGEQVNYKVLKN